MSWFDLRVVPLGHGGKYSSGPSPRAHQRPATAGFCPTPVQTPRKTTVRKGLNVPDSGRPWHLTSLGICRGPAHDGPVNKLHRKSNTLLFIYDGEGVRSWIRGRCGSQMSCNCIFAWPGPFDSVAEVKTNRGFYFEPRSAPPSKIYRGPGFTDCFRQQTPQEIYTAGCDG